jgi:hypothetical protein
MNVKVSILFSKNHKVGSKIIAQGTKHLDKDLSSKGMATSHVAILVDDRWVHESTLESGIRVISYNKWLDINQEVAKVPYCNIEYSVIKKHFKNLKNKKYDWLGVAYLGFWIGIKLLIPFVKIPENNAMECPSKYFCCEVVGELIDKNLDMKSPIEVLRLVLSGNHNS